MRQKDADLIADVLEAEARVVEDGEPWYELKIIAGEFRDKIRYVNADLDVSRLTAICDPENDG